METFISNLPTILQPINLLDLGIIAIAVYKLIMMLRGTRAEQLVKGIAILFVFSIVSEKIGLTTVNWVLIQLQKMLVIAIPVLFAPELRKVLANIGKKRITILDTYKESPSAQMNLVEQLMGCLTVNSSQKTGVLIAIARNDGLLEYSSTGIEIDGKVTTALLNNIFIVNTPLHDGAVIIRDGRVVAAGCYLPLSENRNISKSLGTRHRSAIGLTEVSDAIVLIVSEETGAMSVAMEGKLFHDLSRKELYSMLISALTTPVTHEKFWDKWGLFK